MGGEEDRAGWPCPSGAERKRTAAQPTTCLSMPLMLAHHRAPVKSREPGLECQLTEAEGRPPDGRGVSLSDSVCLHVAGRLTRDSRGLYRVYGHGEPE